MSTPTQITADQIAYKKKVGKLGDNPVLEVGLIGGLHMIVKARAGKTEILGAGPHRAVARHIAKRRNPDIEYTELSKADHIEPQFYESLLPKYEELTDQLRSAQE
jgi:hypothetical protein